MTTITRSRTFRAGAQDGFTMIIALMVMFVTSLLLVAAFTAANSDDQLAHQDTTQKQAYYAALAGVQEYEYELQSNPDYWETCGAPKSTVPEEASESYDVKLLPASSAPTGTTECSASNPIGTVIESKGPLANTFRIKSVGSVKNAGYTASATRTIIATFRVSGFLDYIYYTNFETLDPGLYNAPAACIGAYYSQWEGKAECQSIVFTSGDEVNGPMHTNDAARVEGSATFGRKGQSPSDVVEINGGTYPSASCEGSAKYYTATSCYTKGATLTPPPEDTTLASYVKSPNEFAGATHLILNGTTNTIKATYYEENAKGELVQAEKTISWPENGLIFVTHGAKACGYAYEAENNDNSYEVEHEKSCGTVYVKGTYSKSLDIGAESDAVIDGNVMPTSVESDPGAEPTGTAVLGLIAQNYVRVYHPCSGYKGNEEGSLENPYIYAAILSTTHSFIVDNWKCGKELGKLHVYGAIAQDYRGAVGTTGGTGYLKDYKYDSRLATDEPPYFLAPLKAGWTIIRETAPNGG
jgi:type II secretory pathway pseudopilin PulG